MKKTDAPGQGRKTHAPGLELEIANALSNLYKPLLSQLSDIQTVADLLLDEAKKLTSSRDGYVGTIDPETGTLVVHTLTRMMSGNCRIERTESKSFRFEPLQDGKFGGLYGHSLNTRTAHFTNEPSRHKASRSAPKGHGTIRNFLAAPVVLGDALVGQIALANKDGEFDESDLAKIEHLGNFFALAIQRHKSEERTREYAALLAAVLSGIKVGFIVIENRSNRIIQTNDVFRSLIGLPEAAIIGGQRDDIVALHALDTGKVRPKGTLHLEVTLETKSKGKIPVVHSAFPIILNGKKHTIETFYNITERKMLESQLLQAQKLESIGQLAAGIAHEINTPCQYVENNTRFLKTAFDDMTDVMAVYERFRTLVENGGDYRATLDGLDAKIRSLDLDDLLQDIQEAISDTLDGIERISTIVKSVKQFAHPGQEKKEQVNINTVIGNAVTVSTNEWKYHCEVQTNLAENLPTVNAVLSQVNQVMLNIIINAAHAIESKVARRIFDKGTISITTTEENGMVAITVQDNGIGIPRDIQSSIFNPFFTTKPPGKGTGQGLAIAHTAIVDNHKGKLTFSSMEGQGSTFRIELPLDTEGAADV
ncbi:ATP-binding protein [Desulfocurvus sp. DL9XJH121]